MKRILNILLVLTLVAGAIFLLGFVQHEQDNKEVWNFDVRVAGDEMNFVNADMIKDQINDLGVQILGAPSSTIDLQKIQKTVLKNPAVKSSEVYKTLDGQVRIDIVQRKPILRIFHSDGYSYYLDESGKEMPLSENYTAHVPVVTLTGRLSQNPNKVFIDLKEIALLIQKDSFLKAQVDCIRVNEQGEYILIPRVGNQEILLGKADELQLKFKKLKAFYQEVVQVTPLDKYETINLKYKNQVVCNE